MVDDSGGLPRRAWPFSRVEAEEKLLCPIAEASFLEIACDEQPLFDYVLQYVSKIMTTEGEPSFSSAKPSKRSKADNMNDTIIMFGKGVGKARGMKRKRDREKDLAKAPVVGLGWHCFDVCPDPPAVDDACDLPAEIAATPAAASAHAGSSAAGCSGNDGASVAAADGAAASSSFVGESSKCPESAEGSEALVSKPEQPQASTVWMLLQTLGAPVKSDMGPCQMYTSLVLFVRGTRRTGFLWELCRTAARAATRVRHNVVSIWRYDMKHNYWQQVARRQPRLLQSVIFDKAQKRRLVEDMTWFLRDDTSDFYGKHGIPYHRSYLFYGPPGAGKTSCIFALAGHFKRNICFIQFNKGTTDDSFRMAVSDAPAESIVVMEDVDALFSVHRETTECSSLSFSGFLNALDGLGAPEDVIFILTTNHPERLDPAVRRPGRVDLHVAFSTPSKEMAAEYFGVFYPLSADAEAAEAAQSFARSTGERLRGGELSMAQLQHFFLECHRRGLDAKGAAELVSAYHFEHGGHGHSGGNRMIA